MNSPLIILNKIFPEEVLNKIQLYLPVNNEIKNAIKKYYKDLYDKKEIDDDEAYIKYTYPKCICYNCPDNGRNKIFKKKDCWHCDEFDFKKYNDEYASDKFHLVIKNNLQYEKIMYNEYYNYDDDEDDM